MKVASSVAMFWFIGAALLVLGCASSRSEPAPQPSAAPPPLVYSFADLNGKELADGAHRGRVTVLLFVTTFDLPSQASARRLEDLYRTHAPRINALAVVVEAPNHADLARSFREVLGLNYPLALASKASLAKHAVFSKIDVVPAWIILDREGRPHRSATGVFSVSELNAAVEAAEKR